MTFNWYKIFNRAEFEATGLTSRELELVLESIGQVSILILKGRLLSIVYEDVMLSIGVTDANPFAFEGYAVYIDANDDVWLGIEIES